MLIKSLIKRQGGTLIEGLFGNNYHFAPDADGNHICDVEDPAAIHRLLSIKEGFALVNPDEQLPAKPSAPAQSIHSEKAERAPSAPVVISDGEREYNLTDMDMEPLQILARDTFGIKVHHKWVKDTIIAKIVEATRVE